MRSALTNTMSETIPLILQCFCKKYTFETSISRTSLPLQCRVCHCTSCRHVSGAMYYSAVSWPGRLSDITGSSLSSYKFADSATVRFCETCSSLIGFHRPPANSSSPEKVMVGTGLLISTHREVIQVVDHIFVGDTIDGGATVWMDKMNSDGGSIPRWKGVQDSSEQLPASWPSSSEGTKDKKEPTTMPLHCHCRGVNLVLKRGNWANKTLPWFVNPTSHKLHAGFDACNSCRTSFSGTDVTNWTFSLLEDIEFAEPSMDPSLGTSFPATSIDLKAAVLKGADRRLATVKFYASSPDVQRYFCSRCSSSIFYAVDDRPEMVDIGIGLLDSSCGARAETWLTWGLGSAIWPEDAKGGWREEVVDAITQNSERYRIENNIPKSWLRVAQEEREQAQAASATDVSA